jgi:hypothetical protein
LQEHAVGKNVSGHLQQTRLDGFEIMHSALLAYCPIPKPKDLIKVRALVLVLEAVFSCLLWAMWSTVETYDLPSELHWDINIKEWDGLCSHNPLTEGINGDNGTTPEQLEEIAAATKAKNVQYMREYGKAQRANPTPEYKEAERRRNQKSAPKTRAKQQQAVADRKFYCQTCERACRDRNSLDIHYETKRHKKRILRGNSDYICTPCDRRYRYESDYNAHCKTLMHGRNTR